MVACRADSVTVYVPGETTSRTSASTAPDADRSCAACRLPITWSVAERTVPLTNLAVWYSVDDGRTFQAVPGCSGMPPRDGQCTWQNPDTLVERGAAAHHRDRGRPRVDRFVQPADDYRHAVRVVRARHRRGRRGGHDGVLRRHVDDRRIGRGHLGQGRRIPVRVADRAGQLRGGRTSGQHRESRSLGQGRIDDPRRPVGRGAPCLALRDATHGARDRVPAAPAGQRTQRPHRRARGRASGLAGARPDRRHDQRVLPALRQRTVDAGRSRHAAGPAVGSECRAGGEQPCRRHAGDRGVRQRQRRPGVDDVVPGPRQCRGAPGAPRSTAWSTRSRPRAPTSGAPRTRSAWSAAPGFAIRETHREGPQRGEHARLGQGRRHVPAVTGERTPRRT